MKNAITKDSIELNENFDGYTINGVEISTDLQYNPILGYEIVPLSDKIDEMREAIESISEDLLKLENLIPENNRYVFSSFDSETPRYASTTVSLEEDEEEYTDICNVFLEI